MTHNHEEHRFVIRLIGMVQGVGYRPHVYKRAEARHIRGWVRNIGADLEVDAEGERDALRRFMDDIVNHPPLLASVEKVRIRLKGRVGYPDFQIRRSTADESTIKRISPDLGVCESCMKEVLNPDSRRFRYPFTNCTQCGPRYSIIQALPYDRCHTTMDSFQQCQDCYDEYRNPESRRFHTQPNCCPLCGPHYKLMDAHQREMEDPDIIHLASKLIHDGSILAIKGLGGFHLCCNARDVSAIHTLRCRKNRPDKPLAVMMRDMAVVQTYCEVSELEQKMMTDRRRPIILLAKKASCDLPAILSPGQKRLGVMLPYLPVHSLLMEDDLDIMVMTSGNRSGLPLQYENHEAIRQLKSVADYFLVHNRVIYNPVDDSVVKVVLDKELVSRRARGLIPYVLKIDTRLEILAVGAEQKSAFCLSQDGYAYLSQYLGDLKDLNAYDQYRRAMGHMTELLDSRPTVFAHDLHPQYASTRYAKEQEGIHISVQHHHAHMVSCMAEHGMCQRALGIIYDGTGLGTDGTIWGGEFLLGDRKSFLRAGRLRPVLLQGGDSVIEYPWKASVSYLFSMGIHAGEYLSELNQSELDVIEQALAQRLNCHWTSSMGRLFDCIASIIGLRHKTTYDAQAAIELENSLDPSVQSGYDYAIQDKSGCFELDYQGILEGVLLDVRYCVPPSAISARFHNTLIDATVDMALRIAEKHGVDDVILSGGVFENTCLLQGVYQKLTGRSLAVYFNQQIPINDGGIAVGQLAVAVEELKG